MHGEHLIAHWSSTRQVIATPSGESENYALTKCGSQLLGLIQSAKDLGNEAMGTLGCDPAAALGIAHRKGFGQDKAYWRPMSLDTKLPA